MADYTLSARIVANTEQFQKSMNNIQGKLDNVSKKFSSVGKTLSGIGTKISVGLTVPLTLLGKKMVQSATDFEENLNKVDVAFGKSANTVKSWSNTAIKEFGLSKNQALQATSLFGDMATSMGLTGPAAAKMSTSLAGLAGDLASFKNVSIDQAMTALNGVFTGETESLKQLGVVMTETNLEEFAAKTGQVYKEMGQAEKVQLRYNYVMEMTKNAQGDYARTADGTANSLRTFQGTLDNLAIVLGQQILPTFTPIIQKATEMANAFAQAPPEVQSLIVKFGALAAITGPLLVGIGKVFEACGSITKGFGTISLGANKAGESLKAMVRNINQVRGALAGDFVGPLSKNQQAIVNFANIAKSKFAQVKLSASDLKSGITVSFSSLGSSLSSFGSKLSSMASSAGSSLLGLGGSLKSAIGPFLPAIAVIVALTAAIVYLFKTNEEFRNSMLSAWGEIQASFAPVLQSLATMISSVVNAIMPALQQLGSAFASLVTAITPVMSLLIQIHTQILAGIIGAIVKLISSVAPLISMLIAQLSPVLTKILSAITPIINSIASSLIPVIQTVINILTTYVIPVITRITTVVASVINRIIQIITPIITFIAGVIGKIISVIATVIGKVAGIFNTVKTTITNVWSGIKTSIGSVITGIINVIKKVISPVTSTFNKVKTIIVGVFNKIKSAWGGLTGFVSEVFSGISDAVQSLVSSVKGAINTVIGGINGAIGLINKIPGVEIGRIPYLKRGTDDWQGGFAYMNEAGRGELTYLPNGSQVIPHDLSVKYAKESARLNNNTSSFDVYALGEYIVSAVSNQGSQIANGLERGVGNIRMVSDNREVARAISNLGFKRG